MSFPNFRLEVRKLPTERGTKIRRFARLAALLVTLLVGGEWLLAQGMHGPGPGGPHARHGRMGPRMHGQGQHRHGPGFMRRLRGLPPEEQNRVLANDERFQNLPPERQQMMRDRMRQWNTFSPEQQERIRQREGVFMSLSPAQRREARNIFPAWRRLEAPRRQVLMQAFRHIRDLPPGQREQFLSSPETQKGFSPRERGLLHGMARLLPEERRTRPDGSPVNEE